MSELLSAVWSVFVALGNLLTTQVPVWFAILFAVVGAFVGAAGAVYDMLR